MIVLTNRQTEVARAAAPIFLAQGFARTTMGDIAAAARMSRQGLYLIFPNKDEVFAAAVTVLNDVLYEELAVGLARLAGLESRLTFVCERWLVGVFDLQRSTPDARDMDDLSFPIVQRCYARFAEIIATLLAEAMGDAVARSTLDDLARALVFAIRGFSATATDGADMRRLVALQIAMTVRQVESLAVERAG